MASGRGVLSFFHHVLPGMAARAVAARRNATLFPHAGFLADESYLMALPLHAL
jgi:hypothetical protein